MCCPLAAFKRIHQCIYNKTAASWGMGGPPSFSPSLLSKEKKPFVIWDIIMTTYVMMSCFDFYATIFQWIFFSRRNALICADRPTGRSRGLQTTTMEDAWMQLLCSICLHQHQKWLHHPMQAMMLASAPPASHWLSAVSHQLQLWPISIHNRPLKSPACLPNTPNLCCPRMPKVFVHQQST